MKTKKVIDYRYLPTRNPILLGVVLWLLLSHINAPQWVWASVFTVFGIAAVGSFINWLNEKGVHPTEVPHKEN